MQFISLSAHDLEALGWLGHGSTASLSAALSTPAIPLIMRAVPESVSRLEDPAMVPAPAMTCIPPTAPPTRRTAWLTAPAVVSIVAAPSVPKAAAAAGPAPVPVAGSGGPLGAQAQVGAQEYVQLREEDSVVMSGTKY